MQFALTAERLAACTVAVTLLSHPIDSASFDVSDTPSLMLANVHQPGTIDITDYWVSEKYDGMRAYWNGTRLLTRSGQRIAAPAWFVERWPRQPMDGELWIGRGRFEELMRTVRDGIPDEAAWQDVRYMVFDLPAHPGTFSERLAVMEQLFASPPQATIVPVRQWRVESHEGLEQSLDAIVAAGGEGLILRKSDSLYVAGRSDDLLKVKRYLDAEAQVVAHLPGTGKYANMLGALEVRTPDGVIFRIGTGFSDAQRAHPPAVGTWVTYRYHGLTAKGVPRFASFLREHAIEPCIEPSHEARQHTK